MHLVDPRTGESTQAKIDPSLKRKINILTLKYRPKCSFSDCYVGFRWFTNGDLTLSETAYLKGQYPKDTDASKFIEHTVPKEIWDTI